MFCLPRNNSKKAAAQDSTARDKMTRSWGQAPRISKRKRGQAGTSIWVKDVPEGFVSPHGAPPQGSARVTEGEDPEKEAMKASALHNRDEGTPRLLLPPRRPGKRNGSGSRKSEEGEKDVSEKKKKDERTEEPTPNSCRNREGSCTKKKRENNKSSSSQKECVRGCLGNGGTLFVV